MASAKFSVKPANIQRPNYSGALNKDSSNLNVVSQHLTAGPVSGFSMSERESFGNSSGADIPSLV